MAALVVAVAAAVVPVARAQGPGTGAGSYGVPQTFWNDPNFVADLAGSYGVVSDREPAVSQAENTLLNRLKPLIQSSRRGALNELRAAVKPDSSAALDFILGSLHYELGEVAQAAARFRTAATKFPRFARAHKFLGLAEVRQGRHGAAVPALVRAVELGLADGASYGLLGYCYLQEGRYGPALTAYRQAQLLQPGSTDWMLGEAQCLRALERWEEAIGHLDELIARHPERRELWLFLAGAHLALDRPLKAATTYELLRLSGGADTAVLYQLGDLYINAGMPARAHAVYTEALAQDGEPAAGDALRAAGILAERGLWKEAGTFAQKVADRFGDSLKPAEALDLLYLRARVARSRGEVEEAAMLLEEVLAQEPLHGDALLALADLRWKDQEDPAAAETLLVSAANAPGFAARARVEHARLRVARSDYRGAAQLLREALQHDPDNPRVRRYWEQVEAAARQAAGDL